MRQIAHRHGHSVLAFAVLVGAVTVFHARGLRPGYTFLPVDLANTIVPWRDSTPQSLQNWLISDPLYQFYPFLTTSVASFKAGTWPLWNPAILLGHPSFADPLAQTFYPFFAMLGLALGSPRAIAIGLWMHVLLAAGLMTGYLRAIRCSWPAALFGALTYALSGYLVTWFETLFWTSTLAWLPGVLWALEAAIQRRRLAYGGLAGVVLGIALLAGQLQFGLAFSLFLGIYAFGRALERRKEGLRTAIWPLVAAGVAIGVGVLIAGVQLAPFQELVPLSNRSADTGLTRLPPVEQLITLIAPNFFGNPDAIGEFWGKLNYSDGTIYAGLVALFLACLAPFVARQRRFLAIYLALVAALILGLMVGGPGAGWLANVPPFNYMSFGRLAFLLPMILAILAALAVDAPRGPLWAPVAIAAVLAGLVGIAVWRNWGNAQAHLPQLWPGFWHAGLLLLATAIVLIVSWRRPALRPWSSLILVWLAFVDVYLVGSHFNPAGPISELTPSTPVIEFLRQNTGEHRVAPTARQDHIALGPNLGSLFGLSEGGGYSSLVPATLRMLFEEGDPSGKHWNLLLLDSPKRNLIDLLQVKYVLETEPLADPGERAVVQASGCDTRSAEITASRPITGAFQVIEGAINRLDMQFSVPAIDRANGTLVVRMWQGRNRQRQVLEARQDASTVQDQQMISWYFAPEHQAPSRAYVWEVAAESEPAGSGVFLCQQGDGTPSVSVYGVDWGEAYSGEAVLYERQAPMPRASVVYRVWQAPPTRAMARKMLDDSFELRHMAVVSETLDLPTPAPRLSTPATIVEYQPTRVVIQAEARQRGLLVLGDAFYPGWEARVDGQPAQIVRTNLIQRGVMVPAGKHVVEFSFQPASLRTGVGVSLTGVAAVLGILAADRWFLRRQKYKRKEADVTSL